MRLHHSKAESPLQEGSPASRHRSTKRLSSNTPGSGGKSGRRPLAGYRLRTIIEAYIFLLPNFIGLLVFLLLPVISVAVLSFFDWNLLDPLPRFVGWQNYKKALTNPETWQSLRVTAYYVLLNIPAQTVLALLLALLMNRKLAGIGIFRILYVIPWMATPIAMGVVWQWIFDTKYGALNTFLSTFGLHGITWLTSEQLVLPAVAAVSIWQYTGYNMLFFLAGLQNIPDYLYESAAIDGATRLHRFFSITLPLLRPTMFFVLVTNVIGSFQVLDIVYTMASKGGTNRAANVFNYHIFNEAFQYFHTGYASALSMILFAILLIVTIFQVIYFNRHTIYDLS